MGLIETYRKAAEFLDLPGVVIEDWGGGTGYLYRFLEQASYVVVDGSPNPFADVVVELEEYRSEVDCVLVRHVLEHNHNWGRVLANAIASAQQRLCVILFTPLQEVTVDLNARHWIPRYGFAFEDVAGPMAVAGQLRVEPVRTETMLYLEKS